MKAKFTASFAARVDCNRSISNALPAVNPSTLAERQENRDNWYNAIKNEIPLVVERIEWLLDGDYGWGLYEVAHETIHNKRMNRVAWLAQAIAAVEWNCPADFARAAWHKLSKDEQNAVNAAIQATMEEYIKKDNEEN